MALIRTNKVIEIYEGDIGATTVSPVCLPWETRDPGHGELKPPNRLKLTGWGTTTEWGSNSGKTSGFLEQIDVQCQSSAAGPSVRCESLEKGQRDDDCVSDVGGPLVIRKHPDLPWFLTGLHRPRKCQSNTRRFQATKISQEVLNWIEKKLEA